MDPTAISDQIERILRSQSFASKSQLRKLLEVLFQNMDSQTTLKPELVIKELWPAETRTKRSADVATEMNRLRHALESYYNGEGKADPITISLPNRSVPGPDGMLEKHWIVAKPREGETAGLRRASEDQRLIPRVSARRGLKLAAAIAAIGIVAYVTIRVLAVHGQPKFGRLDGSTLTILNAEGKELWRKTFPEGFGPDWYYAPGLATRIWFGDLEGKDQTSVLFIYSPAVHSRTRRRWWPNQIAILDSNGKTISEYWHSGGLTHMVLADLDGDGKEEIIATGIANGYDHQATLVVLDPDRVLGASTEVRPEFQIHGMGVAQERLRLFFPRSDLNRALFQFNVATEPTVEHGVIRLTVMECISPPGCRIWYEFDKNFRLIAAFAGGDEFRSAHARFYQTGKDAHSLSAEEQAAFQKVRCLVGCKPEFVRIGNLVP